MTRSMSLLYLQFRLFHHISIGNITPYHWLWTVNQRSSSGVYSSLVVFHTYLSYPFTYRDRDLSPCGPKAQCVAMVINIKIHTYTSSMIVPRRRRQYQEGYTYKDVSMKRNDNQLVIK